MYIDNLSVFFTFTAALTAAILWSRLIRRNRTTKRSMAMIRAVCAGQIPANSPMNQESAPLVTDWK
jgi:hypothetical protein